MWLFNCDTKNACCFLEVRKQIISIIVLSASIDNGPSVFLELNRLSVRESLLLILIPLSTLAPRVKYLAVEELLSFDDGKVLVDLDLPLRQKIGLGKMLDQVVDAVEPVVGVSDHLGSKISHSIGIFCEIRREGRLMTP